jgi:hypothetical protein
MLPKEKHIEVINRLHGAIENIDKQLELGESPEVELDLLRMYRKLTKEVWNDVDNFTEELEIKINKILNG